MNMNENKYYDFDYWFKKSDRHLGEDNYGVKYYAYEIFKSILPLLEIPTEGYIVVLGSHNCVSLELLCQVYGRERCVGFDLFNPTNNDRVRIKDCNLLSDADDLPIAFCHNDLGSFPTTPRLKINGQEWATKNMIEGGILLSRNNLNSAKYKSEDFMRARGFDNIMFQQLREKHPDNFVNLRERDIEGHMFSIKNELV